MRTKVVFLSAAIFFVLGCSRSHTEQEGASLPPPPQSVPAEYAKGEQLFKDWCLRCHGSFARGTTQGPPLVHKIYEPSRHADAAFYRAAQMGVQAHHWRFGNMPPVGRVGDAEVAEIIHYVRWLQREAGIH